jgi:hypothetical protein
MTPELKERLENLAQWHWSNAETNYLAGNLRMEQRHRDASADIRAAIVSADDQTRNMLTLRAWKANQRKYEQDPVSITGFDQLQEQQS